MNLRDPFASPPPRQATPPSVAPPTPDPGIRYLPGGGVAGVSTGTGTGTASTAQPSLGGTGTGAVAPQTNGQRIVANLKAKFHGFIPSGHVILECMLAAMLVAVIWVHETRTDDAPEPAPPPSPVVVTGKVWVTLVHDSEKPTQDFAQLEADPALAKGLNAIGAHLRNFDVSSKVLDERKLRRYVDDAGVPTLIVQAEGTKAIKAAKCPKTATEVLEVVRKFQGGGGVKSDE